jgi:hypothetical protein
MGPGIAVFRGKEIRKTIHNNEWWFSIVDVCAVLTESADPGPYWGKLKQRVKEEGSEVVTIYHGLKLVAPRPLGAGNEQLVGSGVCGVRSVCGLIELWDPREEDLGMVEEP